MDTTRFYKNMKHRPMKTLSENYCLNPTKSRASAAVTILPLVDSFRSFEQSSRAMEMNNAS